MHAFAILLFTTLASFINANAKYRTRNSSIKGLTVAVINNCNYPVTIEANGMTLSTKALAIGQQCANVGTSTGSGNIYFQAQGSGSLSGSNIGIGTLLEWSVDVAQAEFWYDISNVNGYNMPMTVTLKNQPNCQVLSCHGFVCPNDGERYTVKTSNGVSITYCGNPTKDDPNGVFPSAMNKTTTCATAYNWSGDNTKTYQCPGIVQTATVSLCKP